MIHALSHLDPTDLMAFALVNKQFYSLINSSDAWRAAFARFFPGPAVITQTTDGTVENNWLSNAENFRSDRRRFCRLTQASTWRDEYISRAHLLRSLERGRPTQYLVISGSGPTGQVVQGAPTTMFMSASVGQITHLSCNFEASNRNQAISLIHGCNITSEAVLSSTAAAEQLHPRWSTFNEFDVLRRFNQVHVGDAMWGLGSGLMAGCPNVLDVSRTYGAAYGEGLPNGRVFFRSINDKTSMPLVRPDLTAALNTLESSQRPLGVPIVATAFESITAVWIAKSSAIPSLSNGMIGVLSGTSHGILSAYSLGHPGIREEHLNRGEITARWVLSPGVPIIAIAVDDSYSLQRQAQNRIWAVALNALGEVFYLSQMPQRATSLQQAEDGTLRDLAAEGLAWESGRSVFWKLIEPTRRIARPDPYKDRSADGSYSPRSSWRGMCLSDEQIKAETAEIQTFLDMTPRDIQTLCLGWDMRRKMEVDFAGDDGNFAGEAVVVVGCGLEEQTETKINRFTRCKVKQMGKRDVSNHIDDATDFKPRNLSSSTTKSSPERALPIEEWREATLSFGGTTPAFGITSTALDCSKLATITLAEDPLVGSSDNETLSRNMQSFMSRSNYLIPGQRARFLAIGTDTGVVYMWDTRSSPQQNNAIVDPLRVIYTSSPEITCLGVTALYLVHGGSDGLVQLWDPLASNLEPIRTIHGRISARMRRRYELLAGRFPPEWGLDMIGARAVALDSDPQRLRGLVAIGVQLKSWSFRSSNLFGISGKGGKRRLKKSTPRRGSTPVSGPRTDLLDSIQDELHDMKADEKEAFKRKKRLAQRFGVGMLDEDEEMQLALMLSTEAFEEELQSTSGETSDRTTPTAESSTRHTQQFDDTDLAEAIRRSLNESVTPPSSEPASLPASPSPQSNSWNVPVRFARKGGMKPSVSGGNTPPSTAESSLALSAANAAQEAEDLEMAIRLSMEEHQGQATAAAETDEFPSLPSSSSDGAVGKGKGRVL
jgi:F-box domain